MKETDWEQLLSDLPEQEREDFLRMMRSSVGRRLRRGGQCDHASVPEPVRARAVGLWRDRYMVDASKSARRRMKYQRLKYDETYRAIEHELMVKEGYWGDGAHRGVSDMDVDTLMMTYRDLFATFDGTPLAGICQNMLRRDYQGSIDVDQTVDALEERVLHVLRTQDLSRYARLLPKVSQPFNLVGATTTDDVMERVRETRLVKGVLRSLYGTGALSVVSERYLASRLCARPLSRGLEKIVYALSGDAGHIERIAARIARKDAKLIASRLGGETVLRHAAASVLENKRYRKQYERSVELMCRVRENVPETPMDAYPLARTMHRHFVVHVGPTNSGKTYDALKALMAAQSGCYLGPLRLLAYEQFEYLNVEGCPCTLLTGEECMEVAGARHVSSTVEMANYHRQVEVAVIDEAQMLKDPDRGHAWTQALLGIPADVVHVTCAPQALDVVCDLVRLCEDEAEVVWHDRLVPLKRERRRVRVPVDVCKGDALVVFSRRSVHAYAAKVQEAGLKASVIYGALPYDVRQEEARRFDRGETDVVVATDAIGMGMNLPIKRIVFCEQEKFDGRTQRMLLPEEIQQIAGRAGRFGRYDCGLYNATRLGNEVERRYQAQVDDIDQVPVGIPDDICLVRDATLIDAIVQWMALEQPKPFRRIDVSRDLELITYAQGLVEDDTSNDAETKMRILSLARIPFDERDGRLAEVWRKMVATELAGEPFDVEEPPRPQKGAGLASLEADYRLCDLLYTYARMFGYHDRETPLMELRADISRTIMDLLAKS